MNRSLVNMASEQETLANVVKGLHQKLRVKLKEANGDFEKIWKDHCADDENLQKYALAMHSLATDQWSKNSPGGRADWCVKTCQEYFNGGGLVTALEKQKRRYEKDMATSCCCCLNIYDDGNSVIKGKLNLLDVGSCYNPFSAYSEFISIAIDLYPAEESVYKCDFLNLKVSTKHMTESDSKNISTLCSCQGNNTQFSSADKKQHHDLTNNTDDSTDPRKEEKLCSTNRLFPYSQDSFEMKGFLSSPEISELPGSYFHVVVFSLLLSYFPTPAQRWTCCIKAHQLLTVNGILIIITPDSSHQNRNAEMMKSWKVAIESIGFVRWRYVKDTHVHCMVFRKVSPCHHSCSKTCSCKISVDVTPDMLYIRQDSTDDKTCDNKVNLGDNDDANDNIKTDTFECRGNSLDQEVSEAQRKKRKIDHPE